MKLVTLSLIATLMLSPSLGAQPKPSWRSATASELDTALPARAPVEKERIETEKRTASGIVNSHGKLIAGVVLITAGSYVLINLLVDVSYSLLNPRIRIGGRAGES